MGPISTPLQFELELQLEFDLPGSLKVKCESVIRLPMYGFLLMFNSNIGRN